MLIINEIKRFDKNENYGWCSFRDNCIIFNKYRKLYIYINKNDLPHTRISEIIAYTHKYIVVEITYSSETIYYFCDVDKNLIYKTRNDFENYCLIGNTVIFFTNNKYRIQIIGFQANKTGLFESCCKEGIFIFNSTRTNSNIEYTCVDLKNYFLVKIYSDDDKYYIDCVEFEQKLLLTHSLENCYLPIKDAIQKSRKMLDNNPVTYSQDNISEKHIDDELANFYTGNPHNCYFYSGPYSDKKLLAVSYANILGKHFFISRNIGRKLDEITKDIHSNYKKEHLIENEICTEYPKETITETPEENIAPTVDNIKNIVMDKLTNLFMSCTTVLKNSTIPVEQQENTIIEFTDQMVELLIFCTSIEEKLVATQSNNDELINKIKYLETKLNNTEKMLDTVRTSRDFENNFKQITKELTDQIIHKGNSQVLSEHRKENNKRKLNTTEYPPNKYSKN